MIIIQQLHQPVPGFKYGEMRMAVMSYLWVVGLVNVQVIDSGLICML